MDQKHSGYEILLASVFFTACFIFIHPELIFTAKSPMGGDTWTLKDPTVSWSAFMPAFREFKYELLTNGNVLWSNLRGLGQPLLGNTVQGAPLFPLNLALMPLPDTAYWSVMPIARVILIALGLYLVARHIFRLPILPSALFALFGGFNLNVLRWLNHPWTNGLLAGVWYFYFLCRVANLDYARAPGWLCAGLIISVFAMVNAGFPEASMLSALIVIFLFAGFIAAYWQQLNLRRAVALLTLCHLIGFFISAGPLIGLLEYIDYSGAMSLREGFASGHYESREFVPYALSQFSILTHNSTQQQYLAFNVGLWGLFFSVHGLYAFFTMQNSPTKRVHICFAIAYAASMAFFALKVFGLSDALNYIFTITPVLAQSHFHLYFSPLFYLGVAYFAAIGVQQLIFTPNVKVASQGFRIVLSVLTGLLVLFLCAYSANYFSGTSARLFWEKQFSFAGHKHIQLFALFIVVVCLLQVAKLYLSLQEGSLKVIQAANYVCGAALVLLVCSEINITTPNNFISKHKTVIQQSKDTLTSVQKAVEKAPLPIYELRGKNANGRFVGIGVATVDNGVSAILPRNTRQIRKSLFKTKYGGYIPLGEPLRTWSWSALSSNLYIVHATELSDPDWTSYRNEVKMMSRVMDWQNSPQSLTKPFFLEGSSWTLVPKDAPVSVWLNFQGADTDFWVKANIKLQQDRGFRDGLHRRITEWRIRIAAEWIKDDKLRVVIRQVDEINKTFNDAPPETLVFDDQAPESIADRNIQLLGSNKDMSYLIYFDDSALPRAYTAAKCHFYSSKEEEVAYYVNSDAVTRGEVQLNSKHGWPQDFCQNYQGTLQRVPITQDNGKSLTLDSIQGPTLLVVNDSFYPGWRAEDMQKGVELPIKHANTAFRAVYLPEARDYKIHMRYQPDWLRLVYLLLAMAILLILLLYRYLRVTR